ncbi:hypothetical protein K402DRAFT_423026 [Aulographum hederae CBS 113979]|uniref:Fumarylacetoacetase N-terminal domain-containing protein n=1 Tax=Aulographum hederae CBS 113979 TaxID=1176131 RepID=A0A6G1GTD1_9PEZI|nr:hypothetical protein K402DRAFT_423026 [Aulographum hederae CBS 113979]
MSASSNFSVPAASPYSLHVIPLGVFSSTTRPRPRCCTRIGDYIVDLSSAAFHGVIEVSDPTTLLEPDLEAFTALGAETVNDVRAQLATIYENPGFLARSCLVPLDMEHDPVKLHLDFCVPEGFGEGVHRIPSQEKKVQFEVETKPSEYCLPNMTLIEAETEERRDSFDLALQQKKASPTTAEVPKEWAGCRRVSTPWAGTGVVSLPCGDAI